MNRRSFLKRCGSVAALAVAGVRTSLANFSPATGPLRVSPTNPRYFVDPSFRPVFLTGAHTWANFQEIGTAPIPTFDWEGNLNMMMANNHNFMRFWAWQQSAWAPWTPTKILFEPTLYVRTGPGTALDGGPKFDLTQFNPAYFSRMKERLTSCRNRNIY